jgi:flagellar hook protein FlgE
MFSGVSGLRVHQTKMDVIANNISNVNTVGYKSSRVTFMDAFYQRLAGASAENPVTGRTGTNAMQIGLGANVASIDTIMTQGMSQRTDVSTDLMIQGNGFFVVSDASGTYFTRAGKIDRDAAHNLNINGMQLMGWDTVIDEQTGREAIETGPVKALTLDGDKQYVPPKASSIVDVIGNLNVNELPLKPNGTKQVTATMNIYDSNGNQYGIDVNYTYYPNVKAVPDGGISHVEGAWTFEFVQGEARNGEVGVLAYPEGVRVDADGNSTGEILSIHVGYIQTLMNTTGAAPTMDDLSTSGVLIFDTKGELQGWNTYDSKRLGDLSTTSVQTVVDEMKLQYDFVSGDLSSVVASTATPPVITDAELKTCLKKGFQIPLLIAPETILDPPATFGGNPPRDLGVSLNDSVTLNSLTAGNFSIDMNYDPARGITTDFSDLTADLRPADGATGVAADLFMKYGTVMLNTEDFHQFGGQNTKLEMIRADGNRPGTLDDLSIAKDGKITGRYSNGETKLLGQVAVAKFINPAGLEKVGNSLFAVTANSGPWNGVGDVGDIIAGSLEMSNVDLSQEFTEMITTQRGFQANSRIITVSDEMLQELVNLKR